MVMEAVASVETLDGALKQHQPAESVTTLAGSAADKLTVIMNGIQASY